MNNPADDVASLEGDPCQVCGEKSFSLERCRTCARGFCSSCAYSAGWGRFCTVSCARTFFYGDEDGNFDREFDDDKDW